MSRLDKRKLLATCRCDQDFLRFRKRALGSLVTVLPQGRLNGVNQSFFTDRLTQKVHGTRVHCLTFLTRTSMSRDEHDRDVQLGMTEHVLQFKTIHAGHAHVENQASGIFKVPEGQKLAGRAKGFGCETEGSDQPSGRASDRWVVIDDRYKRVLNCATLAFHDRI